MQGKPRLASAFLATAGSAPHTTICASSIFSGYSNRSPSNYSTLILKGFSKKTPEEFRKIVRVAPYRTGPPLSEIFREETEAYIFAKNINKHSYLAQQVYPR